MRRRYWLQAAEKDCCGEGKTLETAVFFCLCCGHIPGERGSLLSGRLHALGFLIE